jgi:hypothetical protein
MLSASGVAALALWAIPVHATRTRELLFDRLPNHETLR